MKNVSSLKSNNTQSPKTPGGISKSLLTPCRRLGLSRNWKKSGPSPFISPLASSGEVKQEKTETRKRKVRGVDDDAAKTSENFENCETTDNVSADIYKTDNVIADIDKTPPSRSIDLPRRKKSKTLLNGIQKSQQDVDISAVLIPEEVKVSSKDDHQSESIEIVSTPVRSKSKKSIKVTRNKIQKQEVEIEQVCTQNELKENINTEQIDIVKTSGGKSPNDLSKECIVVIQKKVFKDLIKPQTDQKSTTISQTLFDSDSDEVPLIHHKKDKIQDEDDDFVEKNIPKTTKSPKIQSKKTKMDKRVVKAIMESKLSQSLDEDDDFEDKKTILIRKTYEKVTKPLKSKSTGSISQRDIDELRARIETKKKLLLAKSLTPETAELRCLIKKWQKGCQDALMELLDLMKGKFPDQNMDYSDMLMTLKIPAALVGYDSENDCFNTPNDEDIILAQFNDL